nr:transposase [Bradyrhizobium sp. 166]
MKEVDRQIEAIERELAQIQRAHPVARLLASIPGVGPITATALAATVPDPTMFRSGREFAAWLGLTPKQKASPMSCFHRSCSALIFGAISSACAFIAVLRASGD